MRVHDACFTSEVRHLQLLCKSGVLRVLGALPGGMHPSAWAASRCALIVQVHTAAEQPPCMPHAAPRRQPPGSHSACRCHARCCRCWGRSSVTAGSSCSWPWSTSGTTLPAWSSTCSRWAAAAAPAGARNDKPFPGQWCPGTLIALCAYWRQAAHWLGRARACSADVVLLSQAAAVLLQEGRGIGLANKIAAYALQVRPSSDALQCRQQCLMCVAAGCTWAASWSAAPPDGCQAAAWCRCAPTAMRCRPTACLLQEKGLDTVDANRALGLPDDCREYSAGAWQRWTVCCR